MRRFGWKALAAWVALTFVSAAAVADIAMPRDKWSPIRLVNEQVKLVLSPAKVTVEATFVLENQKDAVTAVVGYPRGQTEKSLDGFAVTVDGEKVAVGSQEGKGDAPQMRGGPPPGGREGSNADIRMAGIISVAARHGRKGRQGRSGGPGVQRKLQRAVATALFLSGQALGLRRGGDGGSQ